MINQIGKKVPDVEKVDIFIAPEGELNLYYGQIGSGKTYGATADIMEELKRGRQVYATWPIKVDSFDDRESFFMILMNTLLFRKRFYEIPCAENFHFIDAEKGEVDGVYTWNPQRPSEYIDFLNTLNHCSIYLDEAWRVIDSYSSTRDFGVEVRSLILVTRHKFRTINLIAQRPNSIQVTARANMNRFYKFVKLAKWPWIRFARYEFQEMTGESVDETKDPISVKTYWGSKKVFSAYNSYFYGDLNRLHDFKFTAWDLTVFDKFRAFLGLFKKKKSGVVNEPVEPF